MLSLPKCGRYQASLDPSRHGSHERKVFVDEHADHRLLFVAGRIDAHADEAVPSFASIALAAKRRDLVHVPAAGSRRGRAALRQLFAAPGRTAELAARIGGDDRARKRQLEAGVFLCIRPDLGVREGQRAIREVARRRRDAKLHGYVVEGLKERRSRFREEAFRRRHESRGPSGGGVGYHEGVPVDAVEPKLLHRRDPRAALVARQRGVVVERRHVRPWTVAARSAGPGARRAAALHELAERIAGIREDGAGRASAAVGTRRAEGSCARDAALRIRNRLIAAGRASNVAVAGPGRSAARRAAIRQRCVLRGLTLHVGPGSTAGGLDGLHGDPKDGRIDAASLEVWILPGLRHRPPVRQRIRTLCAARKGLVDAAVIREPVVELHVARAISTHEVGDDCGQSAVGEAGGHEAIRPNGRDASARRRRR